MRDDRATATRTAARDGRPALVRVRLADLMSWVLGAAIAAAVCREARPANWFAPELDVARILGLGTAILAIFAWIGLFRQAVAWGWRGSREGGATWVAAIAWRLAVLGLLGAALVAEAELLRGDVSGDDWSHPAAARLRILPLAVCLALAGILAGLAPGRVESRKRPRRLLGLSVVSAAAAGVTFATSQAFIPYLVLLAMNAVRNAMTGSVATQPPGPNLHDRIVHAGIEAAPVLACCLVLGLLVARELRGPDTASEDVGASGRGPWALLTTTVAAATGTVWLLVVTLPGLDRWLAKGLWVVTDARNAAVIVLGFVGLAFGLVARAADRPGRPASHQSQQRRHSWRWGVLGKLIFALILIDVITARLIELILARRVTDGGPVDESWTRWVGWVDAGFDWLQTLVPARRLQPWYLFETPDFVALALLEAWLAWRVTALLLSSIGDTLTPIDANIANPRTTVRFALRWAALTVLMVASLPASFFTGLALVQALILGSA
jgi:hypothetical protein